MVGSMIVSYFTGATVAAFTAIQTAAAFVVNFAVSQLVTRVFADNPETQQDMGVRQQVPPSAVNALPVVYGEAYMGGTFVDAVLTTDQRKMYYVLAISSISPNGQFTFDQTEMYYGDQKIIFDGTEPGKVAKLSDEATPTPNENTKIAGNLFIYLFTSSQSGVITAINSSGSLPSDIMGGSDIQASQRWPSTGRQMNGTAFAIVVLNYNREADTTALQPITFKVKQALNSTGVAKPGDVWYDYITNPVYGGAVDSAFVDSTCVATLNAYSDATITYDDYDGNPQTQARYRINGVLDAGQSVLSNIDRIMSACDSWMAYNAALGQWSVVINKAETTAYAFNDDNIIGEIRVSATDITSSINQVEARFPFKDNRDQAAFVNLELQTLNPSLLYPNEPVNKYSITYDLVNDSVQANYLANRLLEQGREDLIVSFSTTYYGIQVNAGDVVSVTNADYGWSSKLFRVIKVNEASLPDGSLGARLELNEYSAAVYDNFDITQYAPVPNSGLPSASYFSALSAPTVTGYPSATIPNFSVEVYVPVTGRVTFGNLFFTTNATPSAGDWQLLTTASTTNSQPVTNNTYYTFSNLTLNTGTYYFAYLVGNDISQSILSASSTAFVWAPIAGQGPTGPTGAGITGPTGPTGTGSAGPTGQSGLQVARPSVYQWGLSAPSISGSSTYTWATGSYAGPGGGWSTTITNAPSAGFILYTATATVTDVATATSTAFSWTTASIIVSGYAGTNGATGPTGGAGATGPTGGAGVAGASARIMYARIASNPTPVSGTVTVSGDNRPTGAQGSAIWGAAFNVTWYANDPDPSSNNSLYQSDGIYNGTNSSWTTPYISALKVGALSAVSTNTGSLTVSGTFQANTAAISGNSMTGAGGVLYASGNFAFGNSTTNIAFNGSQMTLNGNVVATSNIGANAVTNTVAAYTAGRIYATSTVTWVTVQTATITSSGGVIYIASSGRGYDGLYIAEAGDTGIPPLFRIYSGGVSLIESDVASMSYSITPPASSYTIELQILDSTTGSGTLSYRSSVSNRSLFVMELKR